MNPDPNPELDPQVTGFAGWFCTAALAVSALVAGGTFVAFVFYSLRHGVLREILGLTSMGLFFAALAAWLPVLA